MTKSKIAGLIVAFVIGLFGLSLAITPTTTHAVSVCDQSGISEEVRKANGCEGSGDSTETLSSTIVGILNGIVGAIAVVAVIFVVIGGINYITSQGDPGKTKKAKDTILYAVIGLVIAALAFAIVNFVITNIIK